MVNGDWLGCNAFLVVGAASLARTARTNSSLALGPLAAPGEFIAEFLAAQG